MLSRLRYAGLLFAFSGSLAAQGLDMNTTVKETEGLPALLTPVRPQNHTMISSRFGQYPEGEARQLFTELKRMGLNPRMVTAEVGEDYGIATMRLLETSKAMIVMASDNYGEDSSPYSTYHELKYAFENGLVILPVRLSMIYPPQPPGNPRGEELCKWVLGPSLKFVDWSSRHWNAKLVAQELKVGILEAYTAKKMETPRSCASCLASFQAQSGSHTNGMSATNSAAS